MSDQPAEQAPEVLVQRYGTRGEVVLNRPERRNAVTGPLAIALREAVEELSADPDVKTVLIRGEGGTFCAGLDLKEFRSDPPPEWVPRFPDLWADAHAAIFACPKPVVGALEGAAIAAGSALALSCDFLVAGAPSRFHVAEVRLGMTAPINAVWATWRYGAGMATRLLVEGAPLDGDALVRLGLAVASVPDEQVLDEARALADRLAENDAAAIAGTKAMIRDLSGVGAEGAFRARLREAQQRRIAR